MNQINKWHTTHLHERLAIIEQELVERLKVTIDLFEEAQDKAKPVHTLAALIDVIQKDLAAIRNLIRSIDE